MLWSRGHYCVKGDFYWPQIHQWISQLHIRPISHKLLCSGYFRTGPTGPVQHSFAQLEPLFLLFPFPACLFVMSSRSVCFSVVHMYLRLCSLSRFHSGQFSTNGFITIKGQFPFMCSQCFYFSFLLFEFPFRILIFPHFTALMVVILCISDFMPIYIAPIRTAIHCNMII